MDLNLLRLLDVLMRERSASRTARRLGLSQPAVSQALQRARIALGDPLLIRQGNALLPTERAKSLQAELPRLLAAIDGLIAPPVFDPVQSDREFVIASSDLGQILVLPPVITRFAHAAPLCRLRIQPPPSRIDPAHAPDLLIMGAPPPEGAYRWLDLFTDTFVLIARKKHSVFNGPLTAEEFARLPQVLVSPRAEGFEGPIDMALERVGLRRHVAVMITNFMTLPVVLAGTDFIAAVPSRFAALPYVKQMCSVRPLPLPAPPFSMKLVWHQTRASDAGLAWLIAQFRH